MIPLIDGDVLLYEIGYCGEYKDEEGEHQVREFSFVAELLDMRIKEICEAVFNTEPPFIFLTSSPKFVKMWNRLNPDLAMEFKPNFRLELATKKGYKEQRKQDKPFHYYNIAAHLMSYYDVRLANGIEADDFMAMEQTFNTNTQDLFGGAGVKTVICSRDKDLKMVEGWHYSWPCGKQQAFGPKFIDKLGYIEMGKGKIVGGGLKFFYSQVLTGDAVDNIPGLKSYGPVKTLKLLADCTSEKELFEIVQTAYKVEYGEGWYEPMLEQCQLLWMVLSFDVGGSPVMYRFPYE